MKKAELEQKLHEKIDVIIDQMEDLRAELEAAFAEDGEYASLSVYVSKDSYSFTQAILFSGEDSRSVLNASRDEDGWDEDIPITGSVSNEKSVAS